VINQWDVVSGASPVERLGASTIFLIQAEEILSLKEYPKVRGINRLNYFLISAI
jgi:hypothetical protein